MNSSTNAVTNVATNPIAQLIAQLIRNRDFEALRSALLSAASADTAYDATAYEGGLSGHCGAVAMTIYDAVGGQILSARVAGQSHLWNRLPEELGGIELDLTSCQFGGNGVAPVTQGRSWKIPAGRNKRFADFEQRLSAIVV